MAMRRIIQAIDLYSRHLNKTCGLTGPQLILLGEINRNGEISIGDLAKAISLSQATVTDIISRLEARGLVTRERSHIDRRKVFVTTTAQSETLLKNLPSPLQEVFIQRFSNLQDWEQLMIVSALKRLVHLMDAKEIKAAPILTTEALKK
jgi:DNA-binding MarR family transcriptional regulator